MSGAACGLARGLGGAVSRVSLVSVSVYFLVSSNSSYEG